jgi:molybdate transport system substrate-binding protein
LKISYRHAWLMVQAVNDAAGETLVESAVGGVRGGGARLTERGREALRIFQTFAADVRRHAAGSLGRIVDAQGAETTAVLRLAAAISLQEAVGQILTEFALVRPTLRVHTLFGASNELAAQIAAGAPIDLFLTGDAEHLKGSKPRLLATNGLSIIVPTSSPLTPADARNLAKAKFTRLAVADPACPLGKCTAAYLRRKQLDDRFRERTLEVENSRSVPAAVRSGRADIGIVFTSDAAAAQDFRTLVEVRPKEATVSYYGAVVTEGPTKTLAAEVLEYLESETARRCFQRCGLGT